MTDWAVFGDTKVSFPVEAILALALSLAVQLSIFRAFVALGASVTDETTTDFSFTTLAFIKMKLEIFLVLAFAVACAISEVEELVVSAR